MRFLIEQGYLQYGTGWTASDTDSLYAVIKVDENNNQIGEADAVLDLEEIPKAIQRMSRRCAV